MLNVDRGQEWLAEILFPEPWEQRVDFGPVPGLKEMVDPDLARLRYLLWRREMAHHLQKPWTPFLLGRTSQAVFAALREGPGWNRMPPVELSLPGCRREGEWQEVQGKIGGPEWLGKFQEMLAACLMAAARTQDLELKAQELNQWLEEVVAASWPVQPVWRWVLQIWPQDSEAEEWGAVMSWAAGAEVIPG